MTQRASVLLTSPQAPQQDERHAEPEAGEHPRHLISALVVWPGSASHRHVGEKKVRRNGHGRERHNDERGHQLAREKDARTQRHIITP